MGEGRWSNPMASPPEDDRRIAADRLDLLLNQSQSVLLANIVNPLVLWWIAGTEPRGPWAVWVLSQAVLSGLRWRGRRALRRRLHDGDARFVALVSTLLSLVSGLVWGGGAAYLIAPTPASLLAFSFVVGGMVTAAAGTTAVHFASFVAFTVAALVPLALRLASLPDALVGPMPVLMGLFGLLMTSVAARTHQSLGHSFRLRHENADLVGRLSLAQGALVQANRDLESTVTARTAELVEQRARLAQWIRDTPDGLLSLVDGKVVAFNPALQRLLGDVRSEALLGAPLSQVKGLDGPGAQALLDACRQHGEATALLELSRAGREPVAIEVRASRVDEHTGQVELVLRDVSERLRAEARLRTLEQEAQRAAQLTAIRRFSGGIAHEFNNLLAVILGTVERLVREGPPALVPQLDEVRRAAERGAGVTRQLLSVSQRRISAVATLELNGFVAEQQAMIERLAGQELRVQLSLAEGALAIRVDASELQEALLELLFPLTASPAGQEPPALELATHRDGGEAVFTLTCTGAAGFGAERDVAAARALVEPQGGRIACLDDAERTRVALSWPLDAQPAPRASEAASAREPSASARVLVVDDEPVLLQIVAEALRQGGFAVRVAGSAAEALALLAREGPVDVLLSDVMMPGKDGPTLAREARALVPELRVCFMSGYTASLLSGALGEFPEASVLEKPFSMKELVRTLDALARR